MEKVTVRKSDNFMVESYDSFRVLLMSRRKLRAAGMAEATSPTPTAAKATTHSEDSMSTSRRS